MYLRRRRAWRGCYPGLIDQVRPGDSGPVAVIVVVSGGEYEVVSIDHDAEEFGVESGGVGQDSDVSNPRDDRLKTFRISHRRDNAAQLRPMLVDSADDSEHWCRRARRWNPHRRESAGPVPEARISASARSARLSRTRAWRSATVPAAVS